MVMLARHRRCVMMMSSEVRGTSIDEMGRG